jgi:ribulose-phosphate 3-epimerase
MRKPEIVPSLLSADFSRLAEEIQKVEAAGCRRLHLDVMDGHFVPNISFGPVVIASIRKHTELYFQAHLMIEHPERYIDAFKRAGVDAIIIHEEACGDFPGVVQEIKRQKMDAGVALKPATPIQSVHDVVGEVDMILIMTVEPGFGGQEFIRGTDDKVARLRALLDEKGLETPIGVDGGINTETISSVVEAGATHLIAGNAVFRGDIETNVRNLYESIKQPRK